VTVTDTPRLASGPGDAFAALACLEADLDALTTLDVRSIPGSSAMDLAARVSAAISRLSGLRLAALTAVEDSGVWASDGSRSMPAAIARNEDATVSTIKAEITLAQRLEHDLPLTAAALRAGELSADKAKLLARLAPTSPTRRLALADPETGEAFLLAKARDLDAWALTRVIRYWGYRVDPDRDDADYRDAAHTYELQLADTLDGTHLKGFVSPETGQLLRTALRAVTGVPPATDTRTTAQRNADALHALARYLLDTGEHGGGAKVRPHLNVSVRYETLLAPAGAAGVDPATFTETGQPIPRVVLDRIACDAEVTRIVFGPDSAVLDLGRTQRIVTPLQRRAVITRDQECARPGCHAPPRLCEVHHVIPWHHGGATSVQNSILLCWHHHDFVHTEDITITRVDDHWVFTDRHGRELQ
jgi:hypothetical protein